jgi:hypothetical protein
MLRFVVPTLAVLALAGCGSSSGDVVGRYCNYGSTSRAQYDGCLEHVTVEDVRRAYDRNSDAATYAEECDGVSGDYTGPDNMPECSLAPTP